MSPFELLNEQDLVTIAEDEISAFLNDTNLLSIKEFTARTAVIAIIDDAEMKQLNKDFRRKDSTTDVLSFPHEPDEFDTDESFLGNIAISGEQAHKQAIDNGLSLENELKQLILHGLLHLSGYDHENDNGEMNERELELRNLLKI